jgi:hypothetical protein
MFHALATTSEFSFGIAALILLLVLAAIFLSIFIPVFIVRRKYRNFVLKHSVALKQLAEINKKYQFKVIPRFNMEHSYDNMNFYEIISPRDYLTYQLVYIKRNVSAALEATLDNKNKFDIYKKEIKDACIMDQYDTEELLKSRKELIKFENKFFEQEVKTPTISFSIEVRLNLTNINGAYRTSKMDVFDQKEIKDIILKLNQKKGNFYTSEAIWHSICRVERGKVTNKMRFAVYQRDGYRCRKCHRKTNDLEVDHIYPISKGGKTTFDNLQTLCHKCNVEKGSNIED